MLLSLDTEPAGVALNWETHLKGHLKQSTADERARVEDVLVPAAELWVESLTNRQMRETVFIGYLDEFPSDGSPIRMPKPPLNSVSYVKYYDTNGVLTTWSVSDYEVDFPVGPRCMPGRIYPAYGKYYPSTRCHPKAVQIKFTCGYGEDDIPAALRAAMLLHVGEGFERRENAIAGTIISTVPQGAMSLAMPFLVEV